jgi:hypothetical protein
LNAPARSHCSRSTQNAVPRRGVTNAAPRRVAIVGVKVVHSAIFLVNVASILHVFRAGVWGRPSRWTGPALTAALGECLVFVANRGRCPLTDIVERLGADSGRVSDIFLPRWFADRIPQIFGPLLAVGIFGLAVRRFNRPTVDRSCSRSVDQPQRGQIGGHGSL